MKAYCDTFKITYKTKTAPRINGAVFQSIKETVLGESYDLSLVFVGDRLAKKLNATYRQKNYATDILSFSVDKTSGEIFINPTVARKKAKEFARSESNYFMFLFIHGLFHLKGMDHSAIMEREEKKVRKTFNV